MRIAAVADLHFSPQVHDKVRDYMNRVRDEADVLVLGGDLTNFGRPEEMDSLLNVVVRLRIPTISVLGNHDYESGRAPELMKMMTDAGVKVLDGTAYERDGVGFAGTKGFPGGFGRGALTAFGEPEVKAFVQAAIDESLKLERALSQLRTEKRIVVLHYAPIGDTVKGRAAGDLSLSGEFASGGGHRPSRCRSGAARTRPRRQSRRKDHGRHAGTQRCDGDQPDA